MTRFVVRRSSTRFDPDTPPCPEATLAPGESWWRGKRGKDYERWFIEIDTLDELMAFTAHHNGSVVVETDCYDWPGQPSIEIYDDYRE